MLHDLTWLEPGQIFPPTCEQGRLDRYNVNLKLFRSEMPEEYNRYSERISRVIGNFEDVISFPIIFNYQRLMTMKMADLVCGEYPVVTGNTNSETEELVDAQYNTDFNTKMYETVLDVSRYGDGVWRVYRDENNKNTFTVWDPRQWFPIVSQDGTNTILQNVLCWPENRGTLLRPDWYLVAQVHYTGYYIQHVYRMDKFGHQVLEQVGLSKVNTGLPYNAVIHVKAFTTTDTVYGYDDYAQIDSIVAELMTRVAQISSILDKHADPALTGPVTMLKPNAATGELEFHKGKFYATTPGDNEPKYLTWNGQLEASFRQIEFLVDQLYVLSEMGSALTGAKDGGTQAVSGASMRFKMIAPLAKARRITNAFTNSVRRLLSMVTDAGYQISIPEKNISVSWADGIPNDPRETIELIKLETGENQIVPLDVAITEELNRTPAEAAAWIKSIDARAEAKALRDAAAADTNLNPDDPTNSNATTGPRKGMSPKSKGSATGLNSQKINN